MLHGDGTGTQMGMEMGTKNDYFPKFKVRFDGLDVPKYPNEDVLGTKNNNCSKFPFNLD